ncbi:hypothetical protein MFRU_023g00290 [Monilinia fructicola]|uniref:NADH-cytochrome b5 reductase 1 n=1 Tax=Monilinia fructicola TaxID=38448 RepID=A0A5M9KDP0_MONFR|nr:hypothetical protein EYC84_007093 [Monilinia fructicola]KAG4028192.1 hypothetical protein MFRU_023g00290 [Monilinia fructicola]
MSEIKQYSLSEVQKHNKKSDLWIIVHHNVYDVTNYVEDHPGGIDSLVEVGGQNSTVAFEDVGHSADARETMESYLIGRLEGAPEEDDEDTGLPIPKPDLTAKSKDQDFNSEAPIITVGRAGLKLLSVGSALYLGYEVYSRSPKIGWLQVQDGGFWKGVLISSIATLSVATGIGLYLEKALAIPHKTPYSYPSHFKPTIRIAKPITKVKGYLQPENYQKLPLIKKEKLSSNTHRLTFKLPKDDTILGLPIGQHISIRAEIDGKTVSRSYTPISNNSDPGVLRLVIKMYPDGLLTGKYLEHLQVGDEIEVRGPKGAMRYRKGMVKEMGMVAGGTGITPMYQLIRAICEDPTDHTSVTLLYGNNTEEDILLREELDNFEKKYPENFRVHHVLSKPPPGWTAGVGYVTKDMVKEKFPGPSNDSKVLLCGPPGMVNAMKTTLVELGWQKPRAVSKLPDQVFSF